MPSPDRTSERSGAEPSRAPPARAAPKAKERGEASRAPAMPPAQLAELLDREKGEGAARPPAEVAADLQSGFGNRYTQDVLAARARSRVPGRPPPAAAPAPGVQRAVAIGSADDRLEREAEQVASRVATGQAVPQASISAIAAAPEKKSQQVHRLAADEKAAEQDEARMEQTAARAIDAKDTGEPLPPATRATLEAQLGTDLGDVRVHRGAAAGRSARDLHARAFTHGRDIWLGEGESPTDLGLMAHEATHVVQQNGGVHRHLVQRAGPGSPAPAGAAPAVTLAEAGTIDEAASPKQIVYNTITIPAFKAAKPKYSTTRLVRSKDYKYDERPNNQREVWDASLNGGGDVKLGSELEKKLAAGPAAGGGGGTRVLKHAHANFYLIGTLNELKEAAKRPMWNRHGNPQPKDVDHIIELQISGWPHAPWANVAGKNQNMELLDSAANQFSGREVLKAVTNNVKNTRDYYWRRASDPRGPVPTNANAAFWSGAKPNLKSIKETYDLVFRAAAPGGSGGDPTNHWTWEEIAAGTHLADFQPVADPAAGTTGWAIFPTASGGVPHTVAHSSGTERAATAAERGDSWLKPFAVTKIELVSPAGAGGGAGPADIGAISLALPAEAAKLLKSEAERRVPVRRLGTLPNAAYIDGAGVLAVWRAASIRGLSPIEITNWGVVPGKGFVARGSILPSVPIFRALAIDLVVEGTDVRFSRLFDTGDFALPGPIQVTDSSLEVYAGTNGIGIRGDAAFEVQRLGKGKLEGEVSTAGGFGLSGEFEFDTALFDPAKISMWYRDHRFGGKGDIGIKDGKVRGIRSAHVVAVFEGENIDATGTVQPAIPGIEQGDITLHYSPAEGFAIAATLQLKRDIPGIQGGSVEVKVEKRPDAPDYKVSARGTAQPKIPGIAASVTVAYDDGAFTIEGSAAYDKGMLHGSVQVGVTNRPLGADGRPAGPPPPHADRLRAYGGGSVTMRIAPWLQGTVGLRLLPNGELEISGSIGLPASLEIFPEKAINKHIFSINIDIPILGFAVAGQRVGIFLTIGGGLDAHAGIGPAQLRELGLGITYNPAHEDQTHVTGGAQLFIPAGAGLRLNVHAALGAGIPVVSAQAGLELGGSLAVAGAVVAAVRVDWTPRRGLVLDAAGEIYAEPKLKFDVTGFVKVDADLFITTISLYERRWELAALEVGSGLRFGIRFPVHYEEGKPFNVSLTDVQFEVPPIEPRAVLENLFKAIT